jgi:hypothetical protein
LKLKWGKKGREEAGAELHGRGQCGRHVQAARAQAERGEGEGEGEGERSVNPYTQLNF